MNEWKNFFLSVKDVQMIDFNKVFSWSYLSDSALSYTSPLMALLVYFFLLIIIIGIILFIILKKKNKTMPIYRKLIGHINNMTLWLGILGIIFALSRFQGIYMLSSRFLMLANIFGLIVWTGWIVFYSITKLPKLAYEYNKRKAKEKYLPKQKTKKIRL